VPEVAHESAARRVDRFSILGRRGAGEAAGRPFAQAAGELAMTVGEEWPVEEAVR
jgi:hypothetical protein